MIKFEGSVAVARWARFVFVATLANASLAFGKDGTFDERLDPKRRYDETTFVTAHNAFAASDDGWVYAQQEVGISEQLGRGVRGLMLDLHWGQGGAIEKSCRDVQRNVTKTTEKCHKETKQDCRDVKKTKQECKKTTKKVCEWAPPPFDELCKTELKKVCKPVEYTERVCESVDDIVCAPGTAVEVVTTRVCDGAEVLVPTGERRPRLCHESGDGENCPVTRTALAPLQPPRTLSDGLKEVRKFLDDNPLAVVTIFFESYIKDKKAIDREFDEAKISHYVFDIDKWQAENAKQANSPKWPTIQFLRDQKTRLVVFSGEKGDGRPENWKHVVETKYDLRQFPNCEIRSETKRNVERYADVPLLTINHFYEISIAQPYSPVPAELLNNPSQIQQRINRCKTETRRLPNFIALDFADNSEGVWKIVNRLNGPTRGK